MSRPPPSRGDAGGGLGQEEEEEGEGSRDGMGGKGEQGYTSFRWALFMGLYNLLYLVSRPATTTTQ